MFDLSFFEIMVIGVVALMVIGPEKLPTVARSIGRFTGRAQRYISQIKEEVNREVRFDELKSLQGEIAAGVNKAKAGMQDEVEQLEASLESVPDALDLSRAPEKPNVDTGAEDAQSIERQAKPRHSKKGSRRNAVRK